jgi:hypothetical protein
MNTAKTRVPACFLMTALLAAKVASAGPFSVSLQVDAESGTENYQANYVALPVTYVSASESAMQNISGGPPGGLGSAFATGTAATGALVGAAEVFGEGAGAGYTVVETSFTDTLTLSAGNWAFLYATSGSGVGVSGQEHTSSVAFTELSFSAGAMTAQGGYVNFAQNVCLRQSDGSGIQGCGGGWQEVASPIIANFTVTKGGTYSIAASLSGEADALGGDTAYSCNGGRDVCYTLYSSSADISYVDPSFYLEPLSAGETWSAASGTNYIEPPSTVPEPGSLALLSGALLAGFTPAARRRLRLRYPSR